MKVWSFAIVAATGFAWSAVGAPASAAPQWSPIEAATPPAVLSFGVYTPGEQPLFEHAQFLLWGGRNYCWYDFGWHGPGYYWCGYARRRGFGWGGPRGWHGWGGHGYRGGYGHFGGGYRGGGYHGRGGGYHGGGYYRGHGGGGFHGSGRSGGSHGGGHRGGGHGRR